LIWCRRERERESRTSTHQQSTLHSTPPPSPSRPRPLSSSLDRQRSALSPNAPNAEGLPVSLFVLCLERSSNKRAGGYRWQYYYTTTTTCTHSTDFCTGARRRDELTRDGEGVMAKGREGRTALTCRLSYLPTLLVYQTTTLLTPPSYPQSTPLFFPTHALSPSLSNRPTCWWRACPPLFYRPAYPVQEGAPWMNTAQRLPNCQPLFVYCVYCCSFSPKQLGT